MEWKLMHVWNKSLFKCNSYAMLYFCREFYRSVVLKIYYVTGEMVIVVENNYSDSKLNGIVITIK